MSHKTSAGGRDSLRLTNYLLGSLEVIWGELWPLGAAASASQAGWSMFEKDSDNISSQTDLPTFSQHSLGVLRADSHPLLPISWFGHTTKISHSSRSLITLSVALRPWYSHFAFIYNTRAVWFPFSLLSLCFYPWLMVQSPAKHQFLAFNSRKDRDAKRMTYFCWPAQKLALRSLDVMLITDLMCKLKRSENLQKSGHKMLTDFLVLALQTAALKRGKACDQSCFKDETRNWINLFPPRPSCCKITISRNCSYRVTE